MLLEQTFKSYVDIVQDLDKTSKLSLNMIMTRLTGKNEEDSFLLVWEDIINNRSVGTEIVILRQKNHLLSMWE